nr:RNA-guided endonuclease IscB [Ferrovum sp.]
MAVFVLDRSGKTLMPCSEKRARLLLARNRARVHRIVPFVIRLKDRLVSDSQFQPIKVKLDPGSKVTGIAVVRESVRVDAGTGEARTSVHVLSLFELAHRGRQISEALTARRQMRRRRRGDLRYRAPRFLNRGNKGKGWLPPSLQHRIITTMSWVKRLQRWAPVTGADQELVRFDLQKMGKPEIAGVEYQQGTLAGYEVREYMLEKWGRKCAYCGAEHVPLNIDHIHPKAKGGTNRVSNLTLACVPCNQKKGAQDVRTFVKDAKRLERILGQASRSLKDAAAVNSTRWALFGALKQTGLPVVTGSGGLTKFNRAQFGIPKAHALDAACVGSVSAVLNWKKPTLSIKATGRGCYQRTRLDAFGFPRGYLMRKNPFTVFKPGTGSKPWFRSAKRPEPVRGGLPFVQPAASIYKPRQGLFKAYRTGIAKSFNAPMGMVIHKWERKFPLSSRNLQRRLGRGIQWRFDERDRADSWPERAAEAGDVHFDGERVSRAPCQGVAG